MERNGAADRVIWLREEHVVCLSLELQQTECALMHDVNDLYEMGVSGHILIVDGLISSYPTPLTETEKTLQRKRRVNIRQRSFKGSEHRTLQLLTYLFSQCIN